MRRIAAREGPILGNSGFQQLAKSERGKNFIRAAVPRPIRNWLRSPSRSAEWLLDSVRFYAGATKSIDLVRDLRIVCHPQAYRTAFQYQVNDPSQHAEFEHFVSLCSPDLFLFDVGAHFGIFSVAAALKGGRAVAVDPSPAAVRMISRQLALNRCKDKVQIVRAAVSDSNGVIDLLSSGAFSHGFFKVVEGRQRRDLTRSTAITIDDMALRFGVPTHIKIDVEGHEAAVLRGARNLLASHSPILLVELHNEMVGDDGRAPDAALDELARLRFNVFSSEGRPLDRDEILSEPISRVIATKNGDGPT
jgi:FkbM family methyltransferase